MKELRKLTADEIDVRIGHVTDKGKAMLLLYKDARCDMALLDEVFGVGNWQSKYELIRDVLFCSVGVRASATAQGNESPLPVSDWVWKESNGVESQGTGNNDPNNIKGEASDAFKRACVMWGIGRELYEWKGIWIDYDEQKDKYLKFTVKEISYDAKGNPLNLIIEDSKGNIVYNKKGKTTKKPSNKVSNSNASNHTENKENNVETKNSGSQGNNASNEELQNEITKLNRTIWREIREKFNEYAFANEVAPEDAAEMIKTEPFTYLTQELKMPSKGTTLPTIELVRKQSNPKINGNKVVVVDDEFYESFKKYLKDKVFLPF